jgi:dienelactone hydrolase
MKFYFALLLSGIDLCIAANRTVVLNPPGPKLQLGTTTADITDYSRTNTWAPGGNNTDPRTLQISVFYPVGVKPCYGGYQTQYVPQEVSDFERSYFAPYGVLGEIDYAALRSQFYRKCSHAARDYPVVVFSPGYYRTRLLYGVLAQSVAKSGYIVVTVDHPYDGDVVVLADGKVIRGIDDATITGSFQPAIDVRLEDLKFLLNKLSDTRFVKKALPSLPYKLDMSKVGMFGHSLGGAVAANLMLNDKRVVGGINMDGSFFPNATIESLDKPFLLFGSEGHTHFNDQTWNETWANLKGWHAELNINGTRHSSYGDLAYLVKSLGLGNTGDGSRVVGRIDGGVAMDNERTVVVDFMDWVLKGKKRSKLLNGDNEGYPDIYYVGDECTPEAGCEA